MTINETLSNSESTISLRETFNQPETMSFSCGLEAARAGYPSQEATLSETLAKKTPSRSQVYESGNSR